MNKPKIVLLIDLASLKISCEGFKKLLGEIEQKFEVASVKFYGYVAKRNRDFNEYTDAKGYYKVTAFESRRRNKLDCQQIIEGTLIGSNSTVDAVAFATGVGDIIPIISFLKQSGKYVYEIAVEESKYTYAYNELIPVNPAYLREGYASPSTHKAAPIKKQPKPVPEVKPQHTNEHLEAVKEVLSGRSILERYKRN
ncbi:MAG: NYN domain-containing protein [Clostridia bacterium]